MLWVLFSIAAALIWAVTNIIDKYVLVKWVKNPIVPAIILGIVGVLTTIIIYLLQGFQPLSSLNIALALFSGIPLMLITVFYFKAAKIEEISRVVPLFYLAPLFILILGAIFLGEVFKPLQYLGIFLLIIGAITISTKNFKKIRITKASLLMTLAALMISIWAIITKHLLNYADFWTIFSYTRIGTIFILIPMLCFSYPDLVSTTKKHGRKAISIIFLNQSLVIIGSILITVATAIGYVTLVNALVSVQAFFVLLFTIILGISYPKILKEDIKKSIIITKLIAIVLMFTGVLLII